MTFTIPIYIEERSSSAGQPPSFLVRPLFSPEPMQRAEKLSRALTKLNNELYQHLHQLSRQPRHDELAAWNVTTPLEETTLQLRLELKSGSYLKTFFLVGYPALDRKLYFSPSLPALVFEVLPQQNLRDRATTVFTHYFREFEKEDLGFALDEFALQGKARLTTLEVKLNPAVIAKKPAPQTRAVLFGGEEKKDGEQELRKVGRSLNQLYPDDLDRAVGRDAEVNEIARLLAAPDRRPILLVGPRKVGKTTILNELVWQIRSRKKEKFGGGREVWLVSPMRLISGMSYLGEWENRVLAILDQAGKKDRVLYFDDLLGLLTAGMSAASDLNVAQVLMPTMEKRLVRIIAEITPESWRVLRERNRPLADLFHVIPVNEPTEAETLRVLVNVTRQLEEQYRCGFCLDVIPTVCELFQRFAGDAAFPGKAAGFLRVLASKHANDRISRFGALEEFRQQSGLQVAFLDSSASLPRREIEERLASVVVGQNHVISAFADILVTLKARLNDPRRPLGTLLLLGPTGVGKTQSAKALAQFLFGSPDRLLRFDLNEYIDAASATRLVGTPREPEGLLTSAVRRQPFSVVLFDEIEKAAPEVFDLLLAVLDEGRLTDSLGRVTDFTNTVILLTSNLGSREARSQLGFTAGQGGHAAEDVVFVSAAEKFFRPEFFNRIDRIIPFRALEPSHLEGIARQLIQDVFTREGMKRRECLLNISPEAVNRLVQLGYHPQLGARALKRVVEREVAQPMAEKLSSLTAGTPMMVNFGIQGNHFTLDLQELNPVEHTVLWPEKLAVNPPTGSALKNLLEQVYDALDRIETELEPHAPSGKIALGNLPPETAWYFACREQLKKVDRLAEAVERSPKAKGSGSSAAPGRIPRPKPAKLILRSNFWNSGTHIGNLRDAASLETDLADWEKSESLELPDSPLSALLRELALLSALSAQPVDNRPVLLVMRSFQTGDSNLAPPLLKLYSDFFNYIWGGSATDIPPRLTEEEKLLRRIFGETKDSPIGLFLQGTNLRQLIPFTRSSIFYRRFDSLDILSIELLDATTLTEAKSMGIMFTESPVGPTTRNIGPILQVFTSRPALLTDFRTGLSVTLNSPPEEFRAFVLSSLPLPPEITF
jgi:ATP-dependent Clp protease ATP-binding subunit ClpC